MMHHRTRGTARSARSRSVCPSGRADGPDASLRICSVAPNARAASGVSMIPGHMQFTLTLAWANSSAALRVRPTTPCFAALYADNPGAPRTPATDAVFTMAPRFCPTITLPPNFRPPVNAVEVDAQRIGIEFLGGLEQRCDNADSGVVEHDVQAAKLVACRAHQLLDRLRLAHVGRDEQAADGLRDLLTFAAGQVPDDHLRALLCEQFGGCPADARSAASDYRHPVRDSTLSHFSLRIAT